MNAIRYLLGILALILGICSLAHANVGIQGSSINQETFSSPGERVALETFVVNREDQVKADLTLEYSVVRVADAAVLFTRTTEEFSLAPDELRRMQENFSLPSLIASGEYIVRLQVMTASGSPIATLDHEITITEGIDEQVLFEEPPHLRIFYTNEEGSTRYDESYGGRGGNIFPGDRFELRFTLNTSATSPQQRSVSYYLVPSRGGERIPLGEIQMELGTGSSVEKIINLTYAESGTYDLFVEVSGEEQTSFKANVRVVVVGESASITYVKNAQDTYEAGEPVRITTEIVGSADGVSEILDAYYRLETLKDGEVIHTQNKMIGQVPFIPEEHFFTYETEVPLEEYQIRMTLGKQDSDVVYDTVLLNYEPLDPELYMNEQGVIHDGSSDACVDDGVCTDSEEELGNCFDCSVNKEKMDKAESDEKQIEVPGQQNESATGNPNMTSDGGDGNAQLIWIIAGTIALLLIAGGLYYRFSGMGASKKGQGSLRILTIFALVIGGFGLFLTASLDSVHADPAQPPPPPPKTETTFFKVDEFSSLYEDSQQSEDVVDVIGTPPSGDYDSITFEVDGVTYVVNPDGSVTPQGGERSSVVYRDEDFRPFNFTLNQDKYQVLSDGTVLRNGQQTNHEFRFHPSLKYRFVIIGDFLIFENGLVETINDQGYFVVPSEVRLPGSEVYAISPGYRYYDAQGQRLQEVSMGYHEYLAMNYTFVGDILVFDSPGTRINPDTNGYYLIPSGLTTTGEDEWAEKSPEGLLVILQQNPYQFRSSEYLKQRYVIIGDTLIFEDGSKIERNSDGLFYIPGEYTFSGNSIYGNWHEGEMVLYTSQVCGPAFADEVVNCDDPQLKRTIVSKNGRILSRSESIICGQNNQSWDVVNLDDKWYCPLGKSLAETHEPGYLDSQYDELSFSDTLFFSSKETDMFFNAFVPACVNRIPMMRMQMDVIDQATGFVDSSKVGLYATHKSLSYEASPLGGVLKNVDMPEQERFRKQYTVEGNLKSYRMWSFRERFVEGLLRIISGEGMYVPGMVNISTLDKKTDHDLGSVYLSKDFMLGSFEADLQNSQPVGEDIEQNSKIECQLDVSEMSLSGVDRGSDFEGYLGSNEDDFVDRLNADLALCGLDINEEVTVNSVDYNREVETTDTEPTTKTLSVDVSELSVGDFDTVSEFESYVSTTSNYSDLSRSLREEGYLSQNDPFEQVIQFNDISGDNYEYQNSQRSETFTIDIDSLSTDYDEISDFRQAMQSQSDFPDLTQDLQDQGRIAEGIPDDDTIIDVTDVRGSDTQTQDATTSRTETIDVSTLSVSFANVSEFRDYVSGRSDFSTLTSDLQDQDILDASINEEVIGVTGITTGNESGDSADTGLEISYDETTRNSEAEVDVEISRETRDENTDATLDVSVDQTEPYFGFASFDVNYTIVSNSEASWSWRTLKKLTLNNLAICLYNWEACLLSERQESDVNWELNEVADLGYGPRKDSVAYNWAEQQVASGDEYGDAVFDEYFDGARGEKTLSRTITVFRSCDPGMEWVSKSGVYACVNETVYKCHYQLATDELVFNLAQEANLGDTLVRGVSGAAYACMRESDGSVTWKPMLCQ